MTTFQKYEQIMVNLVLDFRGYKILNYIDESD